VVGVVVGALVRVVSSGAAVSSRVAPTGFLFALAALAVFLVVFALLLLCWGKKAAGNLLKEAVWNLLCAVVDGFEC
jgi:hypothetical protein